MLSLPVGKIKDFVGVLPALAFWGHVVEETEKENLRFESRAERWA